MSQRKHVVIVGGGFGGLTCARALARADVDVTLIDRQNHHLFQPLLYQVAMAGLSPSEIAMPIRSIVRKQKNISVLLAEVAAHRPRAAAACYYAARGMARRSLTSTIWCSRRVRARTTSATTDWEHVRARPEEHRRRGGDPSARACSRSRRRSARPIPAEACPASELRGDRRRADRGRGGGRDRRARALRAGPRFSRGASPTKRACC